MLRTTCRQLCFGSDSLQYMTRRKPKKRKFTVIDGHWTGGKLWLSVDDPTTLKLRWNEQLGSYKAINDNEVAWFADEQKTSGDQ